MGDHEGWAEPSGLLLSGLLPNEAASVTRALDMERWLKAEERTAELIACIQPNQPSEERRNAVADYVQRLIMKCFSCEVFTFTFGSVPLKTYLPDGDIDLTAFSMNQNLKDTWAQEVRDMLEKEEKSENAEFHVKEVQYIQAEVKIIKCLVENIVVDISFNQLGGLCTLCFLDQVDHLINQNHLFKRSIILIKAWCYYESRILGAHHGLISTYALETLVLYIFHVFNNSFAGPLEVLYRFLEFFSNFDWENFCVSLWGPVPISSLPEMTAEPPRRDNGELLLSRPFLEFCNLNYAVFPVGQENQGQPFASKHFNVVDPLRTNNNLGRSVSKGNFFRIRSAFAFGAKRLATLLECPKEKLITEIDTFFMNTWERHGGGHRPDAPSPDLWSPPPLNLLPDGVPENTRNHTAIKRKGENIRLTAAHKADGTIAFHGISSQIGDTTNHPPENISRTSNMPTVSRTQSHTIYSNQNSRRISGQFTRDICSSETMHPEKDQRSSRQDYLVNEREGQARCHFARTQSSPELANMNGEVLSRRNRKHGLQETGKKQFSSGRPDQSGRRKNMGSEASTSHSTRSSTDDPSSLRHSSSHQSLDTAAADSNSVSNSYNDDASGLGPIGEELASATEMTDVQQDVMHQEEQDLINMMASSRIHNFNGQVQVPLNFASAHLPVPVSPAVFASMGYAQRNLTGMVPATDIHLVERTWGSNAHFMQSLVSAPNPMPQYFPTGLASNSEEISESDNENSGLTELNQDGNGFWNEHEMGPSKGFDPDDGSFQMLQSNKQPLISSRASSSGSSVVRGQHKFVKDNKGPPREDHCYIPQYQNSIGNDYSDRNMNLRFLPVNANSSRSKPVSESSWDGSSMKASRSVRDKRGKKTGPAAVPPASYRKVKTGGWQHESPSSDHISSPVDDDNREWIPLSAMGSTEMAERSTRPLSVATLPVRDHQLSGYEPAQINESDSMMPIAPMLVGSSSRQRTMDNNGAMPFAFYQTGPPVPYLTMLPVSNFLIETGNTDGSTGHFDRDDGLESSSINQPDQNLNLADSLDQSEIFASSTGRVASVESVEQLKPKPDILNSDFLSHLRNLQYGRLCQTTRNHVPWMYPPSVMVPPVYLQGHFPWDGPGRPLMGSANLFTQLSPHLVPVAPLQPGFNRPVGVFQRFGDDLPRYRSGTGTYLPNPKVAFRDRHSSTKSHWGNYSYGKNDHGDRGGNWNFSSKSRPASRNHGRSQPEKPSSRSDRLMAADSRADRPWDSYRLEPMASYQAQNGSFSSANSMHSSANVSYGMYPIPPMDSNSVPPTGPAVPSVVMLYSYDNNGGYGSQAEQQLEFGSLGPVHFSGMNEALQIGDSGPMHTMYEHRNSSYQGSSDRSSPDQPSSPQLQRSAAQRNYWLKDEDFPPLSFPDQGGNSGGISYSRKSSHYQTFFSNPSHS